MIKKHTKNFFLLLGLCSIMVLSYKTCAQSPLNGCGLMEIENHIDEIEKDINRVYWKIYKQNESIDKDSFYKREKPSSVWEGFKEEKRPSKIIPKGQKCSTYNNSFLEKQLKDIKKKALLNLEEAKNKENEFQEKNKNLNPIQPLPIKRDDVGEETDTISMAIAVDPLKTLPYQTLTTRHYNDMAYACIVVNVKSKMLDIDFLWKNKDALPLESLANAIGFLKDKGKTPVMVMNAGIFEEKQIPLGLFYSEGKELRRFNNKKGEGNFYMEPAGVFIIKKDGTALITEKKDFESQPIESFDIRHATQSGPLLVWQDTINKEFRPKSTNYAIRNGVGVMEGGRVVFAISKEPVNFYEFAKLFKDGFRCKNALYLDGAISQMYLPEQKMTQKGGRFAGMIAISKKSAPR